MSAADDPRAGGWDRWFVVLPFGLLALATLLSLLASTLGGLAGSPGEIALQLGLVTAVAVWMWWWTVAHPTSRGDRRRVHYVGRTALAFALTWVNPFFAVFAFVGYLDADEAFRGRALHVALGVTAVTMAGSQSGGLPPTSAGQAAIFAGLVVLNLGLTTMFVRFQHDTAATSEQRAGAIVELERVNAELAAALASNAELQRTVVDQARAAGVQEERQRLAREIHDTIAQSLAGIVTQLQAAGGERDAARLGERLERATDLARSSLAEARRSVLDLSPATLSERSLVDALTDVVDEWDRHHPPKVDLVVAGDPEPLHPEVEAAVLRVTQEALVNVARHAAARRVGVTLTYADGEVMLDVRDDGSGFDAARPARHGSFGLLGMRQRVERLAGVLDVESAPGRGTAVSARLPSLARGAA